MMFISESDADIDKVSYTGSVPADTQSLLPPNSIKDGSANPGMNRANPGGKRWPPLSRGKGLKQLYFYHIKATSASRITLYHLQAVISVLGNIFGIVSLALENGYTSPSMVDLIIRLTKTPKILQLFKAEARISHEWYEELLWCYFRRMRERRHNKISAWSGVFNGFMFVAASRGTKFFLVKNSWESPIKIYSEKPGQEWVLYQLHHDLHEIYTLEVPMTLRRWLELMAFGRTTRLPGLMELVRNSQGICIGFYWQNREGQRERFKRTSMVEYPVRRLG